MRYYIIAGEASGDLHGANLIKELRAQDTKAYIRCWGGDRMRDAGGHLVKHISELAFMGFFEVVKHLPTILSNISFCKQDILAYKPDVVILIDYPGFNFRLFKFLHQHGIRIFYYISPQLWAWKKGRVKQVKKYVERMFVIFPFEQNFYQDNGVHAEFVGHPLLDELKDRNQKSEIRNQKQQIALLPGSRKQEIAYLLPEYLKVVDAFPDYNFVVTGMSTIGESFYRSILQNSRAELAMDKTYEVLNNSQAAIVTSGTATLETALHGVPEVVCYKGSWVSYFIIRALIDKSISFICIVNLICGKRVVEELIQHDVNKARLVIELKKLLTEEGRSRILKDYGLLDAKLGSEGASQRAASLMIKYLQEPPRA